MPGRSKTNDKRQTTNDKIIAIDGPAGSGKSTVAKGLARRWGFLYVDTGAMYRALTLKAIRQGMDLKEERALAHLAREAKVELKMKGENLQVILDGEDVSRAIRAQSVTEKVRYVARLRSVRREMVKHQRRLAQQARGAVLEGRDIGTVVFPRARYKFYLDARLEERINRRYRELQKMGESVARKAVARDIKRRDISDMARDIAPLKKARDAIYIDTSGLKVAEVVEKIAQLIQQKRRCSI